MGYWVRLGIAAVASAAIVSPAIVPGLLTMQLASPHAFTIESVSSTLSYEQL
jgi:hypothetical protein